MNTNFPRIVSNGRNFRIETAAGKYWMDCGGEGASWIWETRFLWLAKRRLRTVLNDDAEAEARLPGRWKPLAQSVPLTPSPSTKPVAEQQAEGQKPSPPIVSSVEHETK